MRGPTSPPLARGRAAAGGRRWPVSCSSVSRLSLVTLFLLSVIVFAAAQLLPGNVGRNVLGRFATQQAVAAYNHKLGADRPVLTQYWDWISDFAAR